MATDLDIANMALTLIGEKQITDIAGTNKASVVCAQFIDQARQEFLESYRWSVAQRFTQLSSPPDGQLLPNFTAEYSFPEDFIRLLDVYGSSENPIQEYEYAIIYNPTPNGPVLLTRTDECWINYIWDAPYEVFSPLMVTAAASLLATKIVMPLLGSVQDYGLSVQRYELDFAKARLRDAQQSKSNENSGRNKATRQGRFGVVKARFRDRGRLDRFDL